MEEICFRVGNLGTVVFPGLSFDRISRPMRFILIRIGSDNICQTSAVRSSKLVPERKENRKKMLTWEIIAKAGRCFNPLITTESAWFVSSFREFFSKEDRWESWQKAVGESHLLIWPRSAIRVLKS